MNLHQHIKSWGTKIMPKIKPFETHPRKYDEWYDKNSLIYQLELQAVNELLHESGNGVEVGVDSGRFTRPLSIELGLDLSPEMGK